MNILPLGKNDIRIFSPTSSLNILLKPHDFVLNGSIKIRYTVLIWQSFLSHSVVFECRQTDRHGES